MMNETITTVIEYLASSVENNEVTNVEKLTLAIDELENFSMTFEILENSSVSQILQSIRHSKKITIFISERIRSLIKCWRQLLNADTVSVIPNEIKSKFCKTPAVKNGYSNGYVRNLSLLENNVLTNGIINNQITDDTPIEDQLKNKSKSPDPPITKNIFTEKEEALKNMTAFPDQEMIIEKPSNTCPVSEIEDNRKNKTTPPDPEIILERLPNVCMVTEKEDNLQNKTAPPDREIIIDQPSNLFATKENESVHKEANVRIRNISNSVKVDQNRTEPQNIQISQLGKPKVKSTKELLADFSNFIENDVKNKIMMDKISQEDDEPITYFPKDFKIKELVQLSILQEKNNNKHRPEPISLRKRRSESVVFSEPEEKMFTTSKCAFLLEQFNQQCITQPRVVLKHFVPWPNLKKGLQMHAPEIKQPLSKRKRNQSSEETTNPKRVEDPLSMDVINNLLESFEVRAQQKQMISEAIQLRKEQTKVIDNTVSLVDMSLKLKLKIPKVPVIKIRRKKKRKKTKKIKLKPIKIKVKKPRKPWVRPMPPITNYLDDIPCLPPLSDDEYLINADEIERTIIEYSEENITKLAYGVLEGYNCFKHSQTSQIYNLTTMYSNIINKNYLHIFPWVDLDYPAKSTFPTSSDDVLQSIINIPNFYI